MNSAIQDAERKNSKLQAKLEDVNSNARRLEEANQNLERRSSHFERETSSELEKVREENERMEVRIEINCCYSIFS